MVVSSVSTASVPRLVKVLARLASRASEVMRIKGYFFMRTVLAENLVGTAPARERLRNPFRLLFWSNAFPEDPDQSKERQGLF